MKVLSGYRITLPKKYREEMDIEEGDHVIVERQGNSIKITPADLKPRGG